MGNACVPPAESSAEGWAAQKAAMRQTGVEAPPAALMHGGVIRLTANSDHLFDWTPLPQHDEWLQDRLTREEWSALILSINDTVIDCDGFLDPAAASQMRDLLPKMRPGYCAVAAGRMRARWLERGVDLFADIGPPVTLYFKLVPIGSSPANNPAGLGDSSGAAAASTGGAGTVASLPPAYPADNAPPGGPPSAALSVVSVYAFPILVKPAPSHATASSAAAGSSTAEGDSSDSFHLTVSVFRFCPICGATVESSSARKPFCAECGGKWR